MTTTTTRTQGPAASARGRGGAVRDGAGRPGAAATLYVVTSPCGCESPDCLGFEDVEVYATEQTARQQVDSDRYPVKTLHAAALHSPNLHAATLHSAGPSDTPREEQPRTIGATAAPGSRAGRTVWAVLDDCDSLGGCGGWADDHGPCLGYTAVTLYAREVDAREAASHPAYSAEPPTRASRTERRAARKTPDARTAGPMPAPGRHVLALRVQTRIRANR